MSNAGHVAAEQQHERDTRTRRPEQDAAGAVTLSGDPAALLRHLQRTVGNQAVNALLRQYAVQRCGATPCHCSPEERAASASQGASVPRVQEDPAAELIAHRYDALPDAPVQRAAMQRDDDDSPDPPDPFDDPTKRPDPITGPGGPGDTNDRSFMCGLENGKVACKADIGKGDPLDLPGDWSRLAPNQPKPDPNVKGPDNCPPGQYNKLMMACCAAGTHADASGLNCVPDQEQESVPFTVPPAPPAPPAPPGDFPDNSDADTQNA